VVVWHGERVEVEIEAALHELGAGPRSHSLRPTGCGGALAADSDGWSRGSGPKAGSSSSSCS
jgi:hypothetical protein